MAAQTGDAATVPASERRSWPTLPLLTRLRYGTVVYGLQTLLIRPAMTLRRTKNAISPSATAPSRVKTYECRRSLPIRIFFPKNHSPGSALPLLLTIHGGGFVVGDPSDNDEWNSMYANKHSSLVVALNYAKAPGSPFPGPASDLEAIIAAVFADKELEPSIDHSKIAILGWSAGGNLALVVSQIPTIREKLAAVVALYPVADFCSTAEQKVLTRQYKPSLGKFRGSDKDFLLGMAPLFNWAYIPKGTDASDKRLSPLYSNKEDLPRRVFVIGCELDMLANDGWRMISHLAGRPVPSSGDKVGQAETIGQGELILEGDERFAWEVKSGDSQYRWLLVPDTVHGFDMPLPSIWLDPNTAVDCKTKMEKVIGLIGEWLW